MSSVRPWFRKVPLARLVGRRIRRRLWRTFFAPSQRRLGAFFIDPSDHIGKERLVTGDHYEAESLAAIETLISALGLQGGVALDGGANIGNHACWLAGRMAHVVCVEPGRVAGLVLEANLLANGHHNWEIFRCALGAASGSGTLNVINDQNLGSTRVDATDAGTGDVPIRTGDTMLEGRRVRNLPVTLIKLDVEGAEVDALAGLQQTLVRDQPLVCVEVLDADRWARVRSLLAAHGYASFMTLTRTRTAGGPFRRCLDFARGQRWALTPVPEAFPRGGFEMIFCLTQDQARALSAGTHLPGGPA
jgi:FkbM family methyltransferase